MCRVGITQLLKVSGSIILVYWTGWIFERSKIGFTTITADLRKNVETIPFWVEISLTKFVHNFCQSLQLFSLQLFILLRLCAKKRFNKKNQPFLIHTRTFYMSTLWTSGYEYHDRIIIATLLQLHHINNQWTHVFVNALWKCILCKSRCNSNGEQYMHTLV